MSKLLEFSEQLRKKIRVGVATLARAVTVTLGPKGRNVVIDRGFGAPLSTKDGITVAKEVVLRDPFENLAVQVVKEASSRTSDIAGDGTTTAIVLANAMVNEGIKNVASGANPMDIKRGMDKAVKAIEKGLQGLAVPVVTGDAIQKVAAISANNDPVIGGVIAKAMEKVGKDGIITVADAKGIETTLDVVEGTEFDKGYVSPYFVTQPESMRCDMEHVAIFITDKKLSAVNDIVPFLEKCAGKSNRPLLIIADDIEGKALSTLVLNRLEGGLQVCGVKAPGFGDLKKAFLQDLAILTGATLVSDELGLTLDGATPEVLGQAKKVEITKTTTTIIGGGGEEAQVRVRAMQLRAEIDHRSTSEFDKKKLEERLAKLVGGVAVINVGAATETEQKEKKARVEDAVHATRAAVKEGVVPGGGVALIRAADALKELALSGDEKVGSNIVYKALFVPAEEIANNAGAEGRIVVQRIMEGTGAFGFNALSLQYEDLIAAGVLDPLLVTKSALLNAVSVAGLLITTEGASVDKPVKSSSALGDGGMPGMGMGGMGMGGGMGMPGMGGF